MKYFGNILLELLQKCARFDDTFTMMNTVYMAASTYIYNVQRGVLPLEIGMIKLLELSLKPEITKYERNLLKGISGMLNFLPKKQVDASKLGESDLWSSYYSPLLTAIISRAQDNILLRWKNKAAENYSTKRPDAIISDFNNGGLCLAYGECKLGSATDKAVNADTTKLAIFT